MAEFKVTGRIEGDGRPFKRQLDATKNDAKVWASNMKREIAQVFIGVGTVGAIRGMLSEAEKISNFAKRFDVSTQFVQEWKFALDQSESSIEDLGTALAVLGRKRKEALEDPTGEIAKMFDVVGITGLDLQKLNTAELANKLRQIFATTDFGPATEALFSNLFGRGSGDMLRVFREDFGGLIDQAHTLGLVLQEDVVQSLADANDNISAFFATIKSNASSLIGKLGQAAQLTGVWWESRVAEPWRKGDKFEALKNALAGDIRDVANLPQVQELLNPPKTKPTKPLRQSKAYQKYLEDLEFGKIADWYFKTEPTEPTAIDGMKRPQLGLNALQSIGAFVNSGERSQQSEMMRVERQQLEELMRIKTTLEQIHYDDEFTL